MGASDWLAIGLVGVGALMGTPGPKIVRLGGGALFILAVVGWAVSHYWNTGVSTPPVLSHPPVVAPPPSATPPSTPAGTPQSPSDSTISWPNPAVSAVIQVENSIVNGDPMVPLIKMYGAKNISTEPLLNVKAYVTPQLTAKDFAMVFYDPHDDVSGKTSILPGEGFDLYYDMRPTTKDKQGVGLQDYL